MTEVVSPTSKGIIRYLGSLSMLAIALFALPVAAGAERMILVDAKDIRGNRSTTGILEHTNPTAFCRRAAESLKEFRPKDEFESTRQYEQRKREYEAAVEGTVKRVLSDVSALKYVIHNISLAIGSFDADKMEFLARVAGDVPLIDAGYTVDSSAIRDPNVVACSPSGVSAGKLCLTIRLPFSNAEDARAFSTRKEFVRAVVMYKVTTTSPGDISISYWIRRRDLRCDNMMSLKSVILYDRRDKSILLKDGVKGDVEELSELIKGF